jgi:hypothetical protein
MGYGVNINKGWFQQDDKRPHTAGTMLDYMKETSGNTVPQSRAPHVHGKVFEQPLLSKLKKLNSVACSPQANYTNRAAAAC